MAYLQACRGKKEEKGEEKRKKEGRKEGDAVEMVPSIQNYVTYLMENMMFVHVALIEV